MEPKEKKLTWETPVIEDYDIVETTQSGTTGEGQDNIRYS